MLNKSIQENGIKIWLYAGTSENPALPFFLMLFFFHNFNNVDEKQKHKWKRR